MPMIAGQISSLADSLFKTFHPGEILGGVIPDPN